MTYIYKIYNKKKIISKNKLKSTVKHKTITDYLPSICAVQ